MKPGETTILLGLNGAGKTTTLRMISTMLKITSGEVRVNDYDASKEPEKVRREIGILFGGDIGLYDRLTGRENIRYFANLFGIKNDEANKRIDELSKDFGMEDYIDKKVCKFSRGMKQRLGIAQALLNEPKLLICDEPTSALDPIGRKEILDILLKVKERTTVIFSTHILSDVERICDEIAILREGKIALSGDLSQIKKGHMVDCLEVGMKNKEDFIKFLKIIKDNSNINEIQKSENTIYLHSNNIEEVQREVMQGLIDKDLYPIYIRIQEPTLERLFMEAIK